MTDYTYKWLNITDLTKPISATAPAGEDLGFSFDFDEIKEARRFDDPTLSQGAWEHEPKEAEWKKVFELSVKLLQEKSKDIQLLGWLVESLTYLYGLEGFIEGIHAYRTLLETFFKDIYPLAVEDDQEEREVKIEWLNQNLINALSKISIGQAGQDHINYLDWVYAKELENKSKDNPDLKKEALESGKKDEATLQAIIKKTAPEFYLTLLENSECADTSLKHLISWIDTKFSSPPSLKPLEAHLAEYHKMCLKLIESKGIRRETVSPTSQNTTISHHPTATVPPCQHQAKMVKGKPMLPKKIETPDVTGVIKSRQDALYMLDVIADYFEETEPHSPVSALIKKAIRWGKMDLNLWLKEVIKDEQILAKLKDTLDLDKKTTPHQPASAAYQEAAPTEIVEEEQESSPIEEDTTTNQESSQEDIW